MEKMVKQKISLQLEHLPKLNFSLICSISPLQTLHLQYFINFQFIPLVY